MVTLLWTHGAFQRQVVERAPVIHAQNGDGALSRGQGRKQERLHLAAAVLVQGDEPRAGKIEAVPAGSKSEALRSKLQIGAGMRPLFVVELKLPVNRVVSRRVQESLSYTSIVFAYQTLN